MPEYRACDVCGEPTASKYGVCQRDNERGCKAENSQRRTLRYREKYPERNRQYHADHREELNEKKRQHRVSHREEISEKQRQHRASHREELNDKSRQYYASHREEINENRRQGRQGRPEYREELNGKRRQYSATVHGRAVILLGSARHRARNKDLPFDLDIEWIERALEDALASGCPYLGIPVVLNGGKRDNSPSVDQIIPDGGYTKLNTVVCSQRANTLKSNVPPEVLLMFAQNVAALAAIRSASREEITLTA